MALCARKYDVSENLNHYASNRIDSVPYTVKAAGHHGDAQTNKPTKRDGRVGPLIFPLHNADKA